ncbi:vWA domain-containing protein [Mobilitalea sibirica]|uniref:vWA domain-containing protein n=1 Tax=Mobilitalea sibirica TaxID=1462919 RepID=UPI001FB12FC2|nr:vWA domain-containing protein [Mobilitalea sibirica]
MSKQNIIKFVAGIAIVFALVLIIVTVLSSGGTKLKDKDLEAYNSKNLNEKIEYLTNKIQINTNDPRKASIELTPTSLYDELPNIDKYPLVVEGDGDIDIEIFASPEKSGKGMDGWIVEVAEKFNSQGYNIDGKTISVSVRNIASGLGADYIIANKHLPDAFSPSSALWGNLINAQGGEVTLVSERLVGNVAGILVNKSTKDKLETNYGKADMQAVLEAVKKNEMVMGYTNPLASSTGLNFLLNTLYYSDSANLLSEKAKEGFTEFQNNVPYVAYTTMQMRESAASGKLDGMVMEYQTYVNDGELSKYEFVPFGIRHDNPLYEVGTLNEDKKAVLDMFKEYCLNEDNQDLASDYGFNGLNSYQNEKYDTMGGTVLQALQLWKENKDGGKEIIAVFVADVSGSMDGDPINQLKKSLINGAQYINDNNYVGLVSYSSDVTIEVPIRKFDLNQRAYFQGAVEDLRAVGGTATYDGVTIGINMLLEAKEANPQAKVMLFLLSDGETNEGNSLDYVEPVISESGIPIYTIGYNANIDALQTISNINEASSINADSDDVIYKIKNLFNAQM